MSKYIHRIITNSEALALYKKNRTLLLREYNILNNTIISN